MQALLAIPIQFVHFAVLSKLLPLRFVPVTKDISGVHTIYKMVPIYSVIFSVVQLLRDLTIVHKMVLVYSVILFWVRLM